MDSNQLILSTAINGGILALALALFDVGGFWPWLPVGVAALGVILVVQMRHAYVAAAIGSAVFFWPAALLAGDAGPVRIAWFAMPVLFLVAGGIGGLIVRLGDARGHEAPPPA